MTKEVAEYLSYRINIIANAIKISHEEAYNLIKEQYGVNDEYEEFLKVQLKTEKDL